MGGAFFLQSAFIWGVFFVCMKLLEQWWGQALYAVLDRMNLDISLGHVRWRTTALNYFFQHVGLRYAAWWRAWFNVGVAVGAVAMVGSLALLVVNLSWMLGSLWRDYGSIASIDPSELMIITPVVPGINVPSNQLWHLMVALVVSGVIHEAGHALAAASERVRVQSCGMFVTYIYPGAFVDLAEDGLARLDPAALLRIYSAGAWHNTVLAVGSVILLTTMHIWAAPLYTFSAQGPYPTHSLLITL
eukprot:TRINITY_DN6484_c0_g1_i1.p1 TRINITY_DN6484_c0_g1~~TRINITY_DN6484_c0_g1_i1.p1  ORF type:complete len:266 (+),score=46.36 TRINITY_DN6484_c0_g1_i1:66-800(+)